MESLQRSRLCSVRSRRSLHLVWHFLSGSSWLQSPADVCKRPQTRSSPTPRGWLQTAASVCPGLACRRGPGRALDWAAMWGPGSWPRRAPRLVGRPAAPRDFAVPWSPCRVFAAAGSWPAVRPVCWEACRVAGLCGWGSSPLVASSSPLGGLATAGAPPTALQRVPRAVAVVLCGCCGPFLAVGLLGPCALCRAPFRCVFSVFHSS